MSETNKLLFTNFDNSMKAKEIQNHKNKLHNLTTRLINTNNIDEETSINNEIKTETEFLSSLLFIKKNELKKNIINDPKQQLLIMYQQMKQQQQIMQEQKMQQQKMERQMKEQELKKNIPVKLYINFLDRENRKPPIKVVCSSDENVYSIIEKYRKKSLDYNNKNIFIFEGKALHPESTLDEAGLTDNSNIFVIFPRLLG